MKRPILAAIGPSLVALSTSALGQQQWGAQWSTSGGGQTWGGTPATTWRPSKIDNIGNAGQIVFGVDRVMGLSIDSQTEQDEIDEAGTTVETEQTEKHIRFELFGAGLSSRGLWPRLSLDYLPIDGLSLGGSFVILTDSGKSKSKVTGAGISSSTEADQPSEFHLLLHPRVGYAFAFDDTFGIWPRAGFSFYYGSQSQETTDPTTGETVTSKVRANIYQLTLEAMVVISPIEHLAILIGPFADIGVGGKQKAELDSVSSRTTDLSATSFGLAAGMVGYFP